MGNRHFGDEKVFCGEIRTDLCRKVYSVRYHTLYLFCSFDF